MRRLAVCSCLCLAALSVASVAVGLEGAGRSVGLTHLLGHQAHARRHSRARSKRRSTRHTTRHRRHHRKHHRKTHQTPPPPQTPPPTLTGGGRGRRPRLRRLDPRVRSRLGWRLLGHRLSAGPRRLLLHSRTQMQSCLAIRRSSRQSTRQRRARLGPCSSPIKRREPCHRSACIWTRGTRRPR